MWRGEKTWKKQEVLIVDIFVLLFLFSSFSHFRGVQPVWPQKRIYYRLWRHKIIIIIMGDAYGLLVRRQPQQ